MWDKYISDNKHYVKYYVDYGYGDVERGSNSGPSGRPVLRVSHPFWLGNVDGIRYPKAELKACCSIADVGGGKLVHTI